MSAETKGDQMLWPHRRRSVLLLVEDDFATRRALDEFLTNQGFQVLCAASGPEGLDVLDSYELRPRLVILDIRDPVRFRAAQLSLPAVRDVPVVVISPEPRDGRLAQLSVSRVLKKPPDLTALLDCIDQLT